MKKTLSIIAAIVVLFGAISGSVLSSAAVGLITLVATGEPNIAFGVTCTMFALSFVMPESKGGFAYMAFTQGICEKVQSSLVEILGSGAPSLKRTQVGYLQALLSAQNTAGTTIVPIDPGNGKIKQVRIKYIQRGISTDITSTKPTGCTTTLEKEPFEQVVAITKYLGTKGLKFNEAEMRKLCEADSEFMAAVINAEIDPLIVALDKDLITTQLANFGAFNPPVVGAKNVTLLQGALSAPVYDGEATILDDMENVDTLGKPLVIGSGKLGKYVRQVGIGCCNDLGQNIGQAGNLDFFRDRFVEPIIGTDEFIALIPGYVQLLTFNEYKGTYVKENDVFSHSSIVDPVTGLTFDMKWQYNSCDDFYFVQFGLNYELYFIPANAFNAADELSGVNFTFNYKAVQI